MKFRFCGDLDAPEWILAEVSVLSKMSSVRMTLICRQIMAQLLGHGIDYAKMERLTSGKRLQFEPSDIKAMIAALHFIMRSAAKYDVESDVLMSELMQLGLPKDVSTSICKCFRVEKAALRKRLGDTFLQFPRVVSTEWRVDHVIATSECDTVNQPVIRLKLNTTQQHELIQFEASVDKFRVLLSDLKTARALMEPLAE